MAELVIRGAKLFPASRSAGSPSFATAFIYEPESQQRELGELYAVVETLSTAKDPEGIADLIIESFGKAFYVTAEAVGEEVTDTESAERFDHAVKAANEALASLAGGQDATWIGKTSAVIAVASGSELHLTHTGSAEAHLSRKGRLVKVDSGGNDQSHQTHKPFTSIASGHLESGDRLILCTPALLRILSSDQINSLLAESSANSAANKIAEMIESQTGAERVAAVIAEATTAEAISSQPLPEGPPEVAHGPSSPGWFSSAKDKALPVLKKAAGQAGPLASRAVEIAGHGWHFTKTKVGPRAKHHGLRAAAWLRHKLREPKKAKLAIALALVGLLGVGILTGRAIISGVQGPKIKLYEQALSATREGQELWLAGNEGAAKSKLQEAQSKMAELQKSKPGKSLDKALARRDHPDYDPTSVSGLANLIQDILDQIDGLTRISPKQLADLSRFSGREPAFLELSGGKLVVVGRNDGPLIASVDTKTGAVSEAKSNTGPVGGVVDAVTGEAGVYLLTSEPSVWLYRPSNGSLTELNGDWQAGKAIGTYNGNIYILRADSSQILRYQPAGSGFASPTNYLSGGQASRISGATSLAVDGSVITGGGSKLLRFFTGSLAQTGKSLPDSFSTISQVLSLEDGDIVLLLDGKTGRIGTAEFDGSDLTFSKQYELTTGTNLRSVISGDGVTAYGLYQDKLVSFSLSP